MTSNAANSILKSVYPQSNITGLAYANAPPFASVNPESHGMHMKIDGVGRLSANLEFGAIYFTDDGTSYRYVIGRLEGDKIAFTKNACGVTRNATGQNLRDIVADKIAESARAIAKMWPVEAFDRFLDELVCAHVLES